MYYIYIGQSAFQYSVKDNIRGVVAGFGNAAGTGPGNRLKVGQLYKGWVLTLVAGAVRAYSKELQHTLTK